MIGVLLLAPLAISAVAGIGGRASIAVRLALRDLARDRARSGAALGAATLAVGIAATIAISAAAAQAPATVGNLPTNQLNLHLGSGGVGAGNPVPVLTPAQQEALQTRVDQLASTLHAQTVVPIEAAFNPEAPVQPPQPGPGTQSGGQMTASLAQVTAAAQGEEVNAVVELYVATPALLSYYGIKPRQINPNADVITSRTSIGSLQVFVPIFGTAASGDTTAARPRPPTGAAHPNTQTIKQLPVDTSDPNTLITSHAMQTLGLQALPAGWIMQTPRPLTTA